MEVNDLISKISLILGAGLLVLIAFAFLLRETRGQPIRSRFISMLVVARNSNCGRVAQVALASISGFLIGGLICASACYGLLRLYAHTLPDYKEAYEGFGDAMILMFLAMVGLLNSIVVGGVCGVWAGTRTYDRLPNSAGSAGTESDADQAT